MNVVDMFDLKPGVFKNTEICDVKYFIEFNGKKEISKNLAEMLELIEFEKIQKIKTEELDIKSLWNYLMKNRFILSADVYFLEEGKTEHLPFLEFLNKS